MTWNENLINRLFTGEKKNQSDYKPMKWFSVLLIIMEMQAKTKQRHDFLPIGLFLKQKRKVKMPYIEKNREKRSLPYTTGGNIN